MKNYANLFWEAATDSLFNQQTIANVFQISAAKLERDRWQGGGIPYLKLGKTVRYRKRDVLAWLQQHEPLHSTSQNIEANKGANNG